MTLLIGKFNDLVFNRGAIARADAFNLAAVEGGTGNGFGQDAVGLVSGVSQIALNLSTVDLFGKERERGGIRIARLRLKARPVDGAAIEPGRRTGFQPSPLQIELAELVS